MSTAASKRLSKMSRFFRKQSWLAAEKLLYKRSVEVIRLYADLLSRSVQERKDLDIDCICAAFYSLPNPPYLFRRTWKYEDLWDMTWMKAKHELDGLLQEYEARGKPISAQKLFLTTHNYFNWLIPKLHSKKQITWAEARIWIRRSSKIELRREVIISMDILELLQRDSL